MPQTPRRRQPQPAAERSSSAVVAHAPVVTLAGESSNARHQVMHLFDSPLAQAELADYLAGAFPVGQFLGMAAVHISRSPSLAGATLPSIGRAIIEAAAWGLPFMAGRAWMVPYRNKGVLEAQFQVGYQGMVDKLESGRISYVETGAVHQRDQFEYRRGTRPYLDHVPWAPTPEQVAEGDVDPGPYTHFWASAKFRGEDVPKFDVMSLAEVEVIRLRAPSARAASSPWDSDYGEMGRKTVLRRFAKTLPLDLRVMRALELTDAREAELRGEQQAAAPTRRSATLARLQERLAPEYAATQAAPDDGQPDDAPQPARAPETAQATDDSTDSTSGPPGPALVPIQPDAQPAAQQVGLLDDCQAQVALPDGTLATCTLGASHRGSHSDGEHDWPRT